MHSLSDIYTSLINLGISKGPNVKVGTTYLGAVGSYVVSSEFCGGDGSTGNPYQICSWAQLNNVRNHLAAEYILNNNLSSADTGYSGLGNNWQPIGTSTSQFTGSFNGNNKTVSNLTINLPSANYVGLFGYVSGNISNFGLVNDNITGSSFVGGLIGWQNSGTTSNSYISGSVSGVDEVGGLVGDMNAVVIVNSYSTATVNTSGDYAGGLVAWQGGGTITNSHATGNVSGPGDYIGGLVGNQDSGMILQSYATGNVAGDYNVGGLAGSVDEKIYNSYATGNVTGSHSVGGLVGTCWHGTISKSYSVGAVSGSVNFGGLVGYLIGGMEPNSYWNTETSGQSGSAGGVGATTLEMQTQGTFNGWDFSTIWNILAGNYPVLR